MIRRETRMLLRYYLEQGASKSALARRLGISRDTLHRWIRAGDLDRDLDAVPVRYGPRPPVPTKLDAYKAIIEARLAAYPELSAVRLLDEIRAGGYAGGYSQLKAFVRRVRPTPAPAPLIRFATPAVAGAPVRRSRRSEARPLVDLSDFSLGGTVRFWTGVDTICATRDWPSLQPLSKRARLKAHAGA